MIPCFGRRLLEFVPQLRGTITGYTQRVMDNSWDLILTSGGWVGFMVCVCVCVCVCVTCTCMCVCREGVHESGTRKEGLGGTPRILD